VAVVPLVLVLAAWAPAGARQRAGAALVEGMGLDGATAAVVRQLVARPPDASEPVTIVGLVLIVFSVLGFARSLQRTFEAAWELPRSGLRGYGPACAIVTGVGQAVVMAFASLTLRPVLIDQAQRFGVIGVAFALVTALTVFGVLLVLGAVLGPVVVGRVSRAQPRATA
jgi:uncharacterized BrkB/YihY/UPF0761 family membrane protein